MKTLHPVLRRVVLGVAVALLLAVSWLGFSGGLRELSGARTPGQTVQVISQVAYGFLGLLGAVSVFWGRRWSRLILTCWVACVALSAGLSAVVWGGNSLLVGVLSGGVSLLIVLAIVWLLRVGTAGQATEG